MVVASRRGYLVALISFVEVRVRLKSSEAKGFVLLSIIARYGILVNSGLQQPAHILIPPLISLTTRGAVGGGILGFGTFLMTIVVSFIVSENNSSLTFCTSLTCEGECPLQPFVFWEVLSIQRFSGQLR